MQLTLETGEIGRQANGAVMATMGETVRALHLHACGARGSGSGGGGAKKEARVCAVATAGAPTQRHGTHTTHAALVSTPPSLLGRVHDGVLRRPPDRRRLVHAVHRQLRRAL